MDGSREDFHRRRHAPGAMLQRLPLSSCSSHADRVLEYAGASQQRGEQARAPCEFKGAADVLVRPRTSQEQRDASAARPVRALPRWRARSLRCAGATARGDDEHARYRSPPRTHRPRRGPLNVDRSTTGTRHAGRTRTSRDERPGPDHAPNSRRSANAWNMRSGCSEIRLRTYSHHSLP